MNTDIIIEQARQIFEARQSAVYSIFTANQALIARQFELSCDEELAPLVESAIKYTLKIAVLHQMEDYIPTLVGITPDTRILTVKEMDKEERYELLHSLNTKLISIKKVSTALSTSSISSILEELTALDDMLLYQKYLVLLMSMLELKEKNQ